MRMMSRTARMAAYSGGWSRIRLRAKYRFPPPQTREVPGKVSRKAGDFAVLDLTLARIVNGADCRPPLSRGGRDGAIAQLGERVVRNDEVGGSIPPGSTSLRRLRLLRLGKPPFGEGCRGIARRAKTAVTENPFFERDAGRP